MDFKEKYDDYLEKINAALENLLLIKETPEKSVYEAMRYSLMAGGKRIRPVLALAVADMLGDKMDEVIPYACAIEMIHTYSLIHDDLPAMDNDDYRRGRLTNHKVYGEAMAILAGDGLLNYAFEIMLAHLRKSSDNLHDKIKAMDVIAKASGVSGMIGGQVVDLESEGKEIPENLLKYIHQCKTGALIKAPVVSAALLCGVSNDRLECLNQYAEKIGLAFQVKDDILDIEGSLETMGKNSGSDVSNKKSTFITIYGMEESKRLLSQLTEDAEKSLEGFGEKAGFLKTLAQYIARREN